MTQLRITALEDGMVLSSDAVDQAGKVVLPAGSIIDTATRNILLMARVRKVSIRSATVGSGRQESSPASRAIGGAKSESVIMQEHLLRLAHMFQPYRDDPLMREMCRLAIKCAQERLIRG